MRVLRRGSLAVRAHSPPHSSVSLASKLLHWSVMRTDPKVSADRMRYLGLEALNTSTSPPL